MAGDVARRSTVTRQNARSNHDTPNFGSLVRNSTGAMRHSDLRDDRSSHTVADGSMAGCLTKSAYDFEEKAVAGIVYPAL